MAATFNWKIAQLERNTADGGVFTAHWRCDASETVGEDTFFAASYGTVGFEPDASAAGFVAYESLTEETVLTWVYEKLEKEGIESSLQAKIDADKAPTTAAGVPWNIATP